MRALILITLLATGCMRAAGQAPVARDSTGLPRLGDRCWHVELHEFREYQTEIRAPNEAAAIDSAQREWAHDPPDAYYEQDAEPAESVAVRLHANPAAVCQ